MAEGEGFPGAASRCAQRHPPLATILTHHTGFRWTRRHSHAHTRQVPSTGFESQLVRRYAIMAARNPSFKEELDAYNRSLDRCLRQDFGMTLKTFKIVKAVVQLAGAGAGIYAMSLGAPPLAALTMVTIMVSGPEALEYLVSENGGEGS